MKIKTVLIACAVTAAVGFTGYKIAYKAYQASVRPVTVIPVSNLNSWYDGEDSETIYAQLVSHEGQTVELNSEYRLKKVYVKEGDTVKVGDPLLEYDMTMPTLKREMTELNRQILELTLETKQKELEKFKKNPNAALSEEYSSDYDLSDVDYDDDDFTASPNLIEETADGQMADPVSEPAALDLDEETLITDDSAGTGFDEFGDDVLLTDPDNDPEIPGGDDLIEGDDAPVIPDDSEDLIDDEDADQVMADQELVLRMENFLNLEAILRYQYTETPGDLNSENIRKARDIFEVYLSEEPSEAANTVNDFTDAFAEHRSVNIYQLSSDLISTLQALVNDEMRTGSGQNVSQEGSAQPKTAEELLNNWKVSLYRAYANILFYQLVDDMNAVNAALTAYGVTAETMPESILTEMTPQIMKAANSYYQFEVNWKRIRQIYSQLGMEEDTISYLEQAYLQVISGYSGANDRLSDETAGTLSKLIWRIRFRDTIQQETDVPMTEPPMEPITEPGDWDGYDDFGDDDWGGPGYQYTKEEIEEIIREREEDIAEVKLQIREQEISLHKYDRILSKQIIRSKINGIVKIAGTEDGGGSDYGFIVIAGEKGMYVEGTIGELKLDTLKVGDIIHGMSEETGGSFTAEVVEISQYPADANNEFSYFYWGMGEENTNVSNYPFTAYIEDASNLMEGYAEVQMAAEEEGFSIYLDNYMMRTDLDGKNYVYVMGADGLLEKRFVRTGKSLWGSVTQVVSGLEASDYIAFPYGKRVKEGAKTEIRDMFDDSVYG